MLGSGVGCPNQQAQRILDVDGYVHVVDGRTICFERHMFDLSSNDSRKTLFGIAEKLREGQDICVLDDLGDDSGNFILKMRDIGCFPSALQDAICRVRAGACA